MKLTEWRDKQRGYKEFVQFWCHQHEYWTSSYPMRLEDKWWDKIFALWVANGKPAYDMQERVNYLEESGYDEYRASLWSK